MAYDPNILLDGKFKTGYLVSGDDGSKCGNIQKFDGTVDKDYFYAAGKRQTCGAKPRKPILAKNKEAYNRALKGYEDCVAANLALNLREKELEIAAKEAAAKEEADRKAAEKKALEDEIAAEKKAAEDERKAAKEQEDADIKAAKEDEEAKKKKEEAGGGSGSASFGATSGGGAASDDDKPKKGFIALQTPAKIGILAGGAAIIALVLYLSFRNKS